MTPLVAALSTLGILSPQPPQDPTRTISGRVVDLRGEGVPAAPVWAVDPQADEKELARSATDAEGYFRLAGVALGNDYVKVHASAPGMSVGTDWARDTSPRVTLELHDATTVRGVLRDGQGQPVPNAVVGIAPAGRALSRRTVRGTTDENGVFAIANVPLGYSSVSAWIPEQGAALLFHRVRGDDELELAPLDAPITTLEIEIVGLPDEDRPTVTLSLLPYDNGSLVYLPAPYERPVVEGDRWKAEHVPDWRYLASPSAAGFTFEPDEVRWEASKGPHHARFIAKPLGSEALTCAALVRDGQGNPVEGVTFEFRRSNGGPRAHATSDAEGKLAFESPLAAGTSIVVFSTHPDWVVDQEKTAGMQGIHDRRFLEDQECVVDPTSTMELRVVPACTVRGRLVHADGRPAAFARVTLEEASPNRMPLWMTFAYATTDRDGQFAFTGRHHAPGDVRVAVEGSSGFCQSEPFQIATAGTAVDVGNLELAPPATVEGVVVDAQGQPVAGIAVWLRDWDMGQGRQRSGSVTEVITDRQGRYRFLGVPLGGAWLQVVHDPSTHHHEKVVEPFEVEAGRNHEFRIELKN